MSHEEQIKFVEEVKLKFPEMFSNKYVLEIGSLNINGTVRGLFNNCEYHGIDVIEGDGVDEVCWAHEHIGGPYDVIISCESLEHDPFWEKTLNVINNELLMIGGLLIVTAAGPERAEHGTLKTNPTSSGTCQTEYGDHYRNMDIDDLKEHLGLKSNWTYEIKYGRGMLDVNMWAVKNA